MHVDFQGNKPFLLKPSGKDYIWGGHRLKDDFCKDINLDPLAETWECSTHPDGPSFVDDKKLIDILREHPEYLGTHPSMENGLPILVKFIDAANKLSIQVHPSDEYAKEYENGQLGKTEMWYVIDADPEAKLVYGFNCNVNEGMLRRALKNGTIEKYLQFVPVHPGDVFFIESGTVHAIGAGILLAEIQESSNLTYRLYDYGRLGKDGKPRELHIDKAMKVINMKSSSEPRQPIRVLKYKPGYASEFLSRCKYFQIERVLLNTERVHAMADFKTGSTTFEVLLCINGCGVINEADGGSISFFKGDCIFVPADSIDLKLHGKAELLKIGC